MARTKKRYRTEETETTQVTTYRTGIYIRLSKERTETWRNKSQSLETQESLTRTFAKDKGLMVAKTYTDYEYSGTKFNRPAFQEMLGDVKKGLINCILIRDLSRLGRDYIEMGRLIDKVFPFLGVRFISINDNLDTLNGLEEKKSFEVEIKNLVNDLYSKDISKKVTASHIQRARQGYVIAGFAPYGYKLIRHGKGNKLVIDIAVKSIVDNIFQLFLSGNSAYMIANWLNSQRIAIPINYRKTSKVYRGIDDKKEWTSANLSRLIKNPVYRGMLVQRRNNKNLSEDDYIRYDKAHEAYIDEVEYETIVTLISNRQTRKKVSLTYSPNRYKGLVYAFGKKTQMSRQCHRSNRKNGIYESYYFRDHIYDVQSQKKKMVYISESVLDTVVSESIKEEIECLGKTEKLRSKLKTRKDDCLNAYHKQVRQHKQTIFRLREEISDLYASYSLVRTEKEIYLTQKSEKEARIETLSQEIRHCEEAIGQLEEEYGKQISWIKSLTKCQGTDTLTPELLQAIIERIEVNVNKQVTITFRCQLGGVVNV